MNKKKVPCVAFILLKDNNILVEKRNPDKRVDAGKLSIPSGGIKEGETKKQALNREMHEELNILPRESSFLCTLNYHHINVDFIMHYFIIQSWKGDIKMNEAASLHWIPLSDSEKLGVGVDRKAIQQLKQKMNSC